MGTVNVFREVIENFIRMEPFWNFYACGHPHPEVLFFIKLNAKRIDIFRVFRPKSMENEKKSRNLTPLHAIFYAPI